MADFGMSDAQAQSFFQEATANPSDAGRAIQVITEIGLVGVVIQGISAAGGGNISPVDAANRLQNADGLQLFKWATILPPAAKVYLYCEMPQNLHTASVSNFYECNGSAHKFCQTHNFVNNKCPIDGSDLKTV
jgi:hypothetical protein